MHTPLWNLVDRHARAEIGPLVAQVCLTDPGQGIRLTARTRAVDLRLLETTTPGGTFDEPSQLVAPHVRGNDLLAGYAASPGRDFHLDLRWRLLAGPSDPDAWPAFELHLSVRTDRLTTNPQVQVSNRLPPGETLAAADAELRRFMPVASAPSAGLPGCWLHRMNDLPLTCIEMVSPRAVRCELLDGQPCPRIVHRLFPDQVEKGVVLRSWIRVYLASRDGDADLARQLYRQFATPEELL